MSVGLPRLSPGSSDFLDQVVMKGTEEDSCTANLENPLGEDRERLMDITKI